MEKFDHQGYRKDLSEELKKIPKEERKDVLGNEQDSIMYQKAQAMHQEEIKEAIEKRDEELQDKIEKAGVVVEKGKYDKFMKYLESREEGCTCTFDKDKNSNICKMLLDMFDKPVTKLITHLVGVTDNPDDDFIGGGNWCARANKVSDVIKKLNQMGVIVADRQDDATPIKVKQMYRPNTVYGGDDSRQTLSYRDSLSAEIKSIEDHDKRREVLEKEKETVMYKHHESKVQESKEEYFDRLEKFSQKVNLKNKIIDSLEISKSKRSGIERIRRDYLETMYFKDLDQFIKAAEVVVDELGKVYISFELRNGVGDKSEIRMWSEEPVILGPRSNEAIHYTPDIGNGKNKSETFIAETDPFYEDARKVLDSFIASGKYKVDITNKYDLTSGSVEIEGQVVSSAGQRDIKSELIIFQKIIL